MLAALAAACDRPDKLPEAPRVELSASALAFTAPGGGYDPAPALVRMYVLTGQSGQGDHSVPTAVSVEYGNGAGWLTAKLVDRFTMGWPFAMEVQPHVAGLASGTYRATVYVAVNDVINSPFPVPVTLVVPPPRPVVSADHLAFVLVDGRPLPTQEIRVTNGGGGILAAPTVTVDYGQGYGWLSATVVPGTDAHSVVVSLLPGAFAAVGSHTATLTIQSPGAPDQKIVSVTAWVAQPTFEPSQPRVAFSYWPSSDFPAPRTVTITPMVPSGVAVARPTATVSFIGEAWLAVTISGTIPPYTVTLTPIEDVVAGLSSGGYPATVELRSDPPPGAVADVVGRVEVLLFDQYWVPEPWVWPSEDPVQLYALVGGDDPPSDDVTLTDAFGTAFAPPAVSFGYQDGSGWLDAAISGGAAPYTLSIRPHVAGLAAGTYRGWVSLESALGNTAGVTVSLAVRDWLQHGTLLDMMRRPTATALADGRLLVIGQNDDGAAAFQMYDPTAPRQDPTADPFPGSWSWGTLGDARLGHTATLVPGGRVVAAGGAVPCCTGAAVATWEIFDPATGTWRARRPLATPRVGHTATALADGRVLLAGGATRGEAPGWMPPQPGGTVLADAEVLDPSDGTSARTASMTSPRRGASAVRLVDGRVLVAGGRGASGEVLASAELFDPAWGTWTATGSMGEPRADAALVVLPGGLVLVAGGSDGASALASAELYDPANGTWTPTGSMATARAARAVRLPSGKVLAVAGATGDLTTTTATMERYDPGTGLWSDAGVLPSQARSEPAVAVLPGGLVAVVGGSVPGSVPGTGGTFSDVMLGTGETP